MEFLLLGPHKPLNDTTQLTRPTYVCQSSEYAFPRKARQSNLKKKKKTIISKRIHKTIITLDSYQSFVKGSSTILLLEITP